MTEILFCDNECTEDAKNQVWSMTVVICLKIVRVRNSLIWERGSVLLAKAKTSRKFKVWKLFWIERKLINLLHYNILMVHKLRFKTDSNNKWNIKLNLFFWFTVRVLRTKTWSSYWKLITILFYVQNTQEKFWSSLSSKLEGNWILFLCPAFEVSGEGVKRGWTSRVEGITWLLRLSLARFKSLCCTWTESTSILVCSCSSCPHANILDTRSLGS